MFVYILMLGIQISFTGASDLCDVCWCSFESYLLSCSSRNLSSLPQLHQEHVFYIIDVSDNKLTSLNLPVLRRSPALLRRFIASRNKMKTFPTSLLRYMTSLVHLDLSWNAIDTPLSEDHFRDVTTLDYLSFAHNQVSCILTDAFHTLSHLTELDVSYNKLTSHFHSDFLSCFPHDAICDLKNLIVLRISSNYLPGIFERGRFFSCLPNLTLLEASNCGIQSLSKDAFFGLNHMISLDLSDNSIVTWSSEILRGTSSLVYLDVSQNLIEELPENFLHGCPELTHLQLRNNKLTHLNYQWLEWFGKKQITNLNVKEAINVIRWFQTSSKESQNMNITKFDQVLYLDWSENMWLCDCDAMIFVAWFLREGRWFSEVKGYNGVTCQLQGHAQLTVYDNGYVNRKVVDQLLNRCVTKKMTSSKVKLSTRDITHSHIGRMTYAEIQNVTSRDGNANTTVGFFDSLEQSLAPKLPLIIAISVAADIVVYIVILLCIRKYLPCQRKRAAISPMENPPENHLTDSAFSAA